MKVMAIALMKKTEAMPNLRQPLPSEASALAWWYVCVTSGSFALLPSECWAVSSTYSDPQPPLNSKPLAYI
jgi:hypothetical protein